MASGTTPPQKPPAPAAPKPATHLEAHLAQDAQARRIVPVPVGRDGKPLASSAQLRMQDITPGEEIADKAGQIFIQGLYMVPIVGNAMSLYDVGVDFYRLYQAYRDDPRMDWLRQAGLWAVLAVDAMGVIPAEGQLTALLRGGLKEVILNFVRNSAESLAKSLATGLLWDRLGGDAVAYLADLRKHLVELKPQITAALDKVVSSLKSFVQHNLTVQAQIDKLRERKSHGLLDWLEKAAIVEVLPWTALMEAAGVTHWIVEQIDAFGRLMRQAIEGLIGSKERAGRLLDLALAIETLAQQVLRERGKLVGNVHRGPSGRTEGAAGHAEAGGRAGAKPHGQPERHGQAPHGLPEQHAQHGSGAAPEPGGRTGAHSVSTQVSTGTGKARQDKKGGTLYMSTKQPGKNSRTPAKRKCPCAQGTVLSVDYATGDETLAQVDFEVPGIVPLAWARTYRSSLAAYDGSALGARWSSAYHLSLVEDAPGELVFHDGENRAVKLAQVKAGERGADAREHLEIVRPDNTRIELHYPDGTLEQYEYHAIRSHVIQDARRHYRLVSRTGRDGLGHWLAYNETGELTRIGDSHGLHVGLEYTGTHVTAIHRLDVAGTVQETLARYAYSPAGDLISHTNAAGHTRTYAYGQHLLERYTDFNGFGTHLRWDWPEKASGARAPDDARVIHEWRSAPGREEERYDESHFEYHRSHWHTKVSDAQGNATFYRYDQDNQIIMVEPAGGVTQYFAWDDRANLIRVGDDSRVERMEYDDAGRLISHTDAMGQITLTEYDAQGLPVAQTLPTGERIRTVFDSQGRPVSVTDAAGRTTQYQWNAHSRLTALTDPKGGTRSYTWDARGLLACATDCSGQQTQYRYDTRGHLLQRTDALGQTTQYRHDVLGQPETITQADGSTHKFEHDAQGNLRAYTDAAGQTTRWHYNGQGLPTWREDAAGRTLSYRYDGHWQLTELRNENDRAMRFVYDALGQCVEETGFDGKVSQFAYDAAGNQVESLVGGVHTQRWYDGLGRLRKRESRADTGPVVKEEYFYDSHGRLTTARNAEGSKVRFHYDEAGNLIAEEQHSYVDNREYISVTRHAYDALGDRVRTMLPNTRTVDWLHYGSGHVHGVMLDQQPLLDIERDALHRETSRRHAKFTQQRAYNPLGRLTKLEVLGQNQRLASRQMTWNRAGHLERIADAARGDTRYAYDPTGRLLEAIAPDLKEFFAFDPAGNPVDPEKIRPYPTDVETPQERAERHAREAAERAAWNAAHPEKERFSPMDTRRMADDAKIDAWKASLPRCLANMLEEYCRTRYTHDARGNLTSRTPPHGPQWRYEWDAANRLKTAYRYDRRTDLNTPGNPDLAIRFSYDAFGRRTLKEVRYPNGRIERTVFTWDGNTLLLEERFEQPVMTREEHIAQVMQRPAPLEVICEYPPESDPIPVAQRQHQLDTSQWRGMTMYLYEPDSFVPLARLEQTLEEPAHITLGPDGEFIEHPVKSSHMTYFYQNDHLGTPQELVDEEGEIVWLGKYRAWGELRSATQSNGQPAQIRNALRFQGQYCDDETGLHYNLNRYYDPASGRFINRDPIGLVGGINLFQYASNPVEWIDPLGLAGKLFGTGKGQHTATVEVQNSGGQVKSCTTLQSGNMTPEEAALGFPRSTLATHTENRAMRQVPMAAGDTVTIKGQYPPCKSCKGAMNRKAAEIGCAINYVWPDGEWSANK